MVCNRISGLKRYLIVKGFDWGSLPEGSLVVDVGGGIGSTSMTIAKTFSHLRFCIQDRPKTVELGLSASLALSFLLGIYS